VSPKFAGFEGGLSYSPNADDGSGNFKRLVQTGLVHESYFSQNVLRVGGSYTRAKGDGYTATGNAFDDLRSFSGGTTLVLDNELYLGAGFTYNGDSGLARKPGQAFKSNAYGYAASVNYNTGPWTVGAYYHVAKAEGDTADAGRDDLRAWQFGASYRIDTRVRFFGAYYHYRFLNEGGRTDADRFNGGVFLVGTRVTL